MRSLSLLGLFSGMVLGSDHEDRKREIYDRYEVVEFCRTQTLSGAVGTVVDTGCQDYANLADLAAKDIECLARVKETFSKANPPVRNTGEPIYVGIIRWRHRDGIGPGELYWQMYVAARKRKPSEVNVDIKRIYFFRAGSYQRFQIHLDRCDKTMTIGGQGAGWEGLWKEKIDAAILHPNGKVYFFRGNEFMRFYRKSDGGFTKDKVAKIGKEGWKAVWENGVDAALTHPNGNPYFFKESKYRRLKLDEQTGEYVLDKEGSIGVQGWEGVWKEGVDSAVMHANGRAYFFRGNQYRRFNFKLDCVDKEGTIGEDGFAGISGNIDAAVEVTD